MTSWFADDAFWQEVRPLLYGTERIQAAPGEVSGALRLAGALPGQRILDMPCGLGRHAIELARRGHPVTAVDLCGAYLEQLRDDARGLPVRVVQEDMRTFADPGAYDIALCLFTSLGYGSEEDDLQILRNMHASLRPGGALVVDLLGREIAARHLVERWWTTLDDGTVVLEERSIEANFETMTTNWTFLRPGRSSTRRFTCRLHSARSLSLALATAGFGSVTLHGALDGRPYDHRAWRLVAVARRHA